MLLTHLCTLCDVRCSVYLGFTCAALRGELCMNALLKVFIAHSLRSTVKKSTFENSVKHYASFFISSENICNEDPSFFIPEDVLRNTSC